MFEEIVPVSIVDSRTNDTRKQFLVSWFDGAQLSLSSSKVFDNILRI